MTKFLITRCTTFDMAGQAMINGAVNGLIQLYPDAEFGTLVLQKNYRRQDPEENPQLKQYMEYGGVDNAFEWADCCIDLGGLCKGFDSFRADYISRCRVKDIPYIYMAVSFEHPDPAIVKDIPATARGYHSAEEYYRSAWKKPDIVPDISFLIKPSLPMDRFQGSEKKVVFVTHRGKPWHTYLQKIKDFSSKPLQAIFKPDDKNVEWEPSLGIESFHSLPEELYAVIAACSDMVYTCRYHAAVAAIMGGVPFKIPFGMPNHDKYKDLEQWIGQDLETIRREAFRSCSLVKEVLHG